MNIIKKELKKYTSLRVGGISEIYIPNSINELSNFLQNNNKKLLFIGLGSNLLVKDEGFDGIVVITKKLNKIQIINNEIIAEAGTALAKISKFASSNYQSGANFLSAIPGSLGGALTMNAGCFGDIIWNYVIKIKTIDKRGKIHYRNKNDFNVNYRNVVSKHNDEFFIACYLQFTNNAISKKILDQRYQKQPIGLASCGSVFKNPKNDYAARLIESCDLKGFCIGGACISTKHANFIINHNNATSANILALIKHIQITVKNKFGILLETEIVIV